MPLSPSGALLPRQPGLSVSPGRCEALQGQHVAEAREALCTPLCRLWLSIWSQGCSLPAPPRWLLQGEELGQHLAPQLGASLKLPQLCALLTQFPVNSAMLAVLGPGCPSLHTHRAWGWHCNLRSGSDQSPCSSLHFLPTGSCRWWGHSCSLASLALCPSGAPEDPAQQVAGLLVAMLAPSTLSPSVGTCEPSRRPGALPGLVPSW